MIISRSVLLRMRNVSHKSCTENQNTHFVFSNVIPKVVPFMRLCGKKYCTAGQATGDIILWGMRIACWITSTTDTHP